MSTSTPRSSSSSRRYGAAKRLRYQASPGRCPSDTPPPARSSPAATRRRSSTLLLGALEAQDRETAALVAAHPQVAAAQLLGGAAGRAERHGEPGLVLVGQPVHVGRRARLLHDPERVAALREARERPGLVTARRRGGPHAHDRLADHAQHALGAHHQLAEARPGGGRGHGLRAQLARGRHAAHGLDELVDAAVAGRRLPGGARGHPATQGRVLERLREVAERHALLAEAPLQLRAEQPGVDARGERRAVHVHGRRQPAEVERHHPREALAHRLHAAHDARAAAERDHRHAVLRAQPQHGRDQPRRRRGAPRRPGALDASPERIRTRSGYERPTACATRVSRSSRSPSAPSAAASRSRTGCGRPARAATPARTAPAASARPGPRRARRAAGPRRQATAGRRVRPRPSPTSASALVPEQPGQPVEGRLGLPPRRRAHLERAEARPAARALLEPQADPRAAARRPAPARSRWWTRAGAARRATPPPRAATRTRAGSSASTSE